VNSVGHYLHRFLHFCRVRRCKKIREIVLEYFLNFPVLSLIVALIVYNVVDLVFYLLLGSFEMEVTEVLVSMM
jgi:hypothetical protein